MNFNIYHIALRIGTILLKVEVGRAFRSDFWRFHCQYVSSACDLDLRPETLNICSLSAVTRSNSKSNLR